MTVKIGHASIDENGKAKNGKAGDQSKRELCIINWYSRPWTSVIRPKDSQVAEKIAKAMEQACANDNIGYDQYQRTTLFTQAEKNNWDLSKINVLCETDCSALVAVCVNCAGVKVSKDIYTGNELQALKATGQFEVFTTASYLTKSANLKRGDILLGKGHTVIVLSNGSKYATSTTSDSTKVNVAKNFDKFVAGTYETTANLNLRTGAGTIKKVITVIPKGTKVKNYGYYNIYENTKWLLIKVTIGGVTYTGYCSSKYLANQDFRLLVL